MRILVAGGAGFIGVHLVKALLTGGDDVVVLDDFSTGWPIGVVETVVGAESRRGAGLTIIEGDVCHEPPAGRFDLIFNLACPASPIHYQKDRVKTLRTSVVGTYNLLALAYKTGARMVQASTSEIYGDPNVHPQPETYPGYVNPIGPRACYDEGKRAAETLCFDFHRDHKVDVRVSRIFNTYGPWMHPGDGRLVSNFVVQALRGGPITVYGSGAQTRSLCYIDDLVRGLLALAAFPAQIGPVNLGNPEEYKVYDVAELVRQAIDPSIALSWHDLPQDDPRQRRPDITKAMTMLGWAPSTPFSEGLAKTIAYFRQVL